MHRKSWVRESDQPLSRTRTSRCAHLTGLILSAWILADQVAEAHTLPRAIVQAVATLSHPGLIGCPTTPSELAMVDPREVAKSQPAADAEITWESDYLHAMEVANQQKKMLFMFFFDPANEWSQRLESQSLGDATVRVKLREYVCLRLPVEATTCFEGKDIRLLQHPSFKEMLGQPGIAIADFAQPGPLHGNVVSAFPVSSRLSYDPQRLNVILDLPSGTLTQRTLIFAVRIHPEQPASAIGQPDSRLLTEAQSHSDYQAQIRRQGHHHWDSRFPRICALLGCTAREVCAESWPGQGLLEAAIECVRCWRYSSGHWSAVRAQNRGFGYDMKLGANGVWYATGIFGLR